MTMTLDQAMQLKQGDQLLHDTNGDSFSVVSVEPMLFGRIHIALVDNKTGQKTFANESMFDVLSVGAGNEPPIQTTDDPQSVVKQRRGRKAKEEAIPSIDPNLLKDDASDTEEAAE